ncbi:hypothetical protein ACN47E_004020 [Coniothyrium glycines]
MSTNVESSQEGIEKLVVPHTFNSRILTQATNRLDFNGEAVSAQTSQLTEYMSVFKEVSADDQRMRSSGRTHTGSGSPS